MRWIKKHYDLYMNPLSANATKWSNALKQFVGNLATNCLSVFDHFVGLALKGLIKLQAWIPFLAEHLRWQLQISQFWLAMTMFWNIPTQKQHFVDAPSLIFKIYRKVHAVETRCFPVNFAKFFKHLQVTDFLCYWNTPLKLLRNTSNPFSKSSIKTRYQCGENGKYR